MRLFARQGAILLDALRADGTTDAARGSMLSFDELNELLGTAAILKAGRDFAGTPRTHRP